MPQGGALSDGRLVHFPMAGSTSFRFSSRWTRLFVSKERNGEAVDIHRQQTHVNWRTYGDISFPCAKSRLKHSTSTFPRLYLPTPARNQQRRFAPVNEERQNRAVLSTAQRIDELRSIHSC